MQKNLKEKYAQRIELNNCMPPETPRVQPFVLPPLYLG